MSLSLNELMWALLLSLSVPVTDNELYSKLSWSWSTLVQVMACCLTAPSHYLNQMWCHYTPRFNEVERGVYWYHLVRLSVCGQNRVRSVSSTILIGSISYLHILSSTFRRCVACNARLKNLKFWRIFKLCNFDFVFFWLGIQYDSMVWVIMRRGYPQNAGVLVHLCFWCQNIFTGLIDW